MTAPARECQPEANVLREVVAGIIDPAARFQDMDGVVWSQFEIQRRDMACRKADSILALIPPAATLQARVDELTKALEPFANIALLHDFDPAAGDMIDMPDFAITPNDIRIARSALSLERSGGAT